MFRPVRSAEASGESMMIIILLKTLEKSSTTIYTP